MSEMAYFAQMACGCVVMAAVDAPEYAKDNAKTIASHVRMGHVIGRATVAEVKAMKWAKGEHARGKADCDGNPLPKMTEQLTLS